jgi:hypothetical protein
VQCKEDFRQSFSSLNEISFAEGPLPSVIQEVDLPIINNNDCEKMYRDAGYEEHIPSIFICAGYAQGGKDSCEVNYFKEYDATG